MECWSNGVLVNCCHNFKCCDIIILIKNFAERGTASEKKSYHLESSDPGKPSISSLGQK